MSDQRDTDESFITVAIHSEVLDKALKTRAKGISQEILDSYTGDLKFQCHALGIPIPFLPVDGEDEYKLFSRLLLFVLKRFDDNEMALKWMEFVDGVKIFPKHPHQLRKYHKVWERNRRVKDAVENMKSETKMLESLNKELMPAELVMQQEVNNEDLECNMLDAVDEEGDIDIGGADDDSIQGPSGLLHFPQAVPPAPTNQLPMCARRPAHELGGLFVGFDRIGDNPLLFQPLQPLPRLRGMRGPDHKQRKPRTCTVCIENGRHQEAKSCVGRSKRNRCPYFKGESNT